MGKIVMLPRSKPPKPSNPSPQPPLYSPSIMASKPSPQLPVDSPWIISIKEKLNQTQQYEDSFPWKTLSIYRVPKSLREADSTAYTPKIVSLGPYHHGRLDDMDQHKWRGLHRALTRAGHDVRLYLDLARSLEDRARACYENPLSISSDAFVQSLVLDAVFALELFRGVADEGFERLGYAPNDPVFSICGAMYWFPSDMIMLENQLPLFVLNRFLALQLGHEPSRPGLIAPLALTFFDNFSPTGKPLSSAAIFDLTSDGGSSEPLHCLDVFRRSLILAGREPDSSPDIHRRSFHARPVADKPRLQLIRCVTELRDAGFEFEVYITNQFWDITFKDGVLYIPHLLIQDGTKSLFLNLIAFELCHKECTNTITSYVSFMGNLINSAVDVGYLRRRQIIEHCLGNDEEVADLFNRLCQEVIFDLNESYIFELTKQVNEYYHTSPKKRMNYYMVKWQKWRAILRHKYFSNPWAIISLIAAAVLLLLSSAQTFYAVYGYYKPNS